MNWEDLNKEAFWLLVQTWLLASKRSPDQCVSVLFEAQRCRKTEIPMDLPVAVGQFLKWQIGDDVKPEWVKHALGGGIA